VSEQRANERDRKRTLQGQVLYVTSFAPEKAGVLLTEDAIAENAQASSLFLLPGTGTFRHEGEPAIGDPSLVGAALT
jgi:hypothetical protein